MINAKATVTYIDSIDVEHDVNMEFRHNELLKVFDVPEKDLHQHVQVNGDVLVAHIWQRWLSIEDKVGDIKAVKVEFDYAVVEEYI